MALIPEAAVPEDYGPFVAFRHKLGFLPNLFRAQTLLPRAIEAEAGIAACVLFGEKALPRDVKESVILAIAAANATPYCLAAHRHVLLAAGKKEADLDQMVTDLHGADLPANETRLLDFCRRLAVHPSSIGSQDIQELRKEGFSDEAILEAVQTTALGQFLCTLATGVGAEPDFETGPVPDRVSRKDLPPPTGKKNGGPGPYLRYVERTERDFPPFAFFREAFGFIPNIFRAQTLSPDVVEAEARAVDTVLLSEDILRRVQKEYVLLAVSAANLNTYCVAVHCEMLRGLGIPEEISDQIAIDHHLASLSEADTALLDFALKLATRPTEYGASDVAFLRGLGFSDTQILEAVVMTSLTQFLNTLQMGLGTIPDLEPRIVFDSPRYEAAAGPASGDDDEDSELVARSQAGDVAAFEELVLRHVGRIYRTVARIVGMDDAEDEVQNAFLKAFEHIKDFRGASRFSTWLTRIAINEALTRCRKSMKEITLEETHLADGEEPFRPRYLNRWVEDPELAYSRQETRELVDRALMEVPAKYRLPVLLRDVEELSGAEAASVLGLPLATMKTQLLRGRMMLREALAPHFSRQDRGVA